MGLGTVWHLQGSDLQEHGARWFVTCDEVEVWKEGDGRQAKGWGRGKVPGEPSLQRRNGVLASSRKSSAALQG